MTLRIKTHTNSPKFAGMDVIGKRIFDLTLAAKVPHDTPAHNFITRIQLEARRYVPNAHVLPPTQTHITVVNPIYKMDGKHKIPGAEEQSELFVKFLAALKSPRAQSVFSRPIAASFGEVLVRQRDVKLLSSTEISPISAVQAELEAILKEVDPRFDFEEGHPYFHSTILRFGPAFSEGDHAAIMRIIERAVSDFESFPLNMAITPDNLFAVEFDGLFVPWIREAAISI